jgi:hypothetical protein
MNDRLRKKVSERPADSEIDQADAEALDELQQRLAKDIEELAAVAKVALPFDLDKLLTKELERHIDALDEAADSLEEATGMPNLNNAALSEALARLAEQLGAAGEQVEGAMMPPIEHLEAIIPLLAAQETFVELARRQRDLAERATALEGDQGGDVAARQGRFRDLAVEQIDIRKRLDLLLTEIEELADQLPDDPNLDKLRETARWFAEDVRDTFVLEDMDQATGALVDSNARVAAAAARTAADKLEAFIEKLDQGFGRDEACELCELVFAPTIAGAMKNTIGQLLGMMTGKGGAGSGMAGRGQTGMYGHLPVALGLLGGDGRSDDPAGDAGRQSSAPGGADRPGTITATGPTTAAPTARNEPPATYRRRVADYFRRLAEELDETP